MKKVTAALAIFVLKAVSISPAVAGLICGPFGLSQHSEVMLNGGATADEVFDAMFKSTYYKGNACWYEVKGYALENKSSYPKFNALMQSKRLVIKNQRPRE